MMNRSMMIADEFRMNDKLTMLAFERFLLVLTGTPCVRTCFILLVAVVASGAAGRAAGVVVGVVVVPRPAWWNGDRAEEGGR